MLQGGPVPRRRSGPGGRSAFRSSGRISRGEPRKQRALAPAPHRGRPRSTATLDSSREPRERAGAVGRDEQTTTAVREKDVSRAGRSWTAVLPLNVCLDIAGGRTTALVCGACCSGRCRPGARALRYSCGSGLGCAMAAQQAPLRARHYVRAPGCRRPRASRLGAWSCGRVRLSLGRPARRARRYPVPVLRICRRPYLPVRQPAA
jgi:hypothetical protein